jgi:hypothetical protein
MAVKLPFSFKTAPAFPSGQPAKFPRFTTQAALPQAPIPSPNRTAGENRLTPRYEVSRLPQAIRHRFSRLPLTVGQVWPSITRSHRFTQMNTNNP